MQPVEGEERAMGVGRAQQDGGRRERIEAILRRGIEEQQRAYDSERHLVGQRGGGTVTFRPSVSLWLAHALLHRAATGAGSADDVSEAAAIVEAVLNSQEAHPSHPHRGNFLWLADDEEVVDLNAVQFVLRGLLPLLLDHDHWLPHQLLARCRDAVRLALDEQERMAVAPTYTNIHLMSLFSLLVGGEWLDDARARGLGRARWDAWVVFTAESGAPHEYNSPGYGGVDLSALAALHQYVRDPRVKLQARLFYERLWLHMALHFHRPTGLLAGPHCRCYWSALTTGHGALHDLLWRETGRSYLAEGAPARNRRVPASTELALTDHWIPDVVRDWIERQPQGLPSEVRETANREVGADLTTYLTTDYALGTASRTYSIGQDDFYIEHQANHLLLQYARPPAGVSGSGGNGASGGAGEGGSGGARWAPWGSVYSRYVVNDRHYGTMSAAPDRPPNAFYDQGNFAAVQRRNKAIALYALEAQHEEVFSLKTVVAFRHGPAGRSEVEGRELGHEEVWAGDRRVTADDLPVEVAPGDWLVVADGAVYAGVRPLEASCLGREAPVILELGPEGELWLTIYNYRGPAKRFWEYASLHGAFWRGNVRAGFIIEATGRADYPSAAAFLEHLRAARVGDEWGQTPDSPLVRTVRYGSGDDEIELRYDLWRTCPLDRRINGAPYRSPALESPLAVQGSGGELRLDGATLRTEAQPVWLATYAPDPGKCCWVAVNPVDSPTPLRLETPLGAITATRWGLGRIEWRACESGEQTVVLDTLEEPADLRVPPGTLVVIAEPMGG